MEIGQSKPSNKSNLIQKPNANFIGGIQIVDSKESNLTKDKNDKIQEQLKTLKDEDLEDLPELD